MNTSKPGLPCTFSKRCSNLLIPVNRSIFNMSVGYNLEGIKQPPMQQFIDNMMDASDHPKFAQYRDTLNKLLQ